MLLCVFLPPLLLQTAKRDGSLPGAFVAPGRVWPPWIQCLGDSPGIVRWKNTKTPGVYLRVLKNLMEFSKEFNSLEKVLYLRSLKPSMELFFKPKM